DTCLKRAENEMSAEVADVDLPVTLAHGVEVEEPDRRCPDQDLLVVEVPMHEGGDRHCVVRGSSLEAGERRAEGRREAGKDPADEGDPGPDDGEIVGRAEAAVDLGHAERVEGGECRRYAPHDVPAR